MAPDTHGSWFERASSSELNPQKLEGGLAFMWESLYVFQPTRFAMSARELQKGYDAVWSGFKRARQ